ncbi:hypothetical protein HDU98_000929, partial [Podochytrium sp. JEL0797]
APIAPQSVITKSSGVVPDGSFTKSDDYALAVSGGIRDPLNAQADLGNSTVSEHLELVTEETTIPINDDEYESSVEVVKAADALAQEAPKHVKKTKKLFDFFLKFLFQHYKDATESKLKEYIWSHKEGYDDAPPYLSLAELNELNSIKLALENSEVDHLQELARAMVGADGCKQIEDFIKEGLVKYGFQAIGILLSLCPLVPSQLADFIGGAGEKINSWGNQTDAALLQDFELLIDESHSFMELLFNTQTTLVEFTESAKQPSDGTKPGIPEIDLTTETASFANFVASKIVTYGELFGECESALKKWKLSRNDKLGKPYHQVKSGFMKTPKSPKRLSHGVSVWVLRKFREHFTKPDSVAMRIRLNMARSDIRDEIIVYIGITSGKTLDAVREGFRCLEQLRRDKEALESQNETLQKKLDGLDADMMELLSQNREFLRNIIHSSLDALNANGFRNLDTFKPHLVHTAFLLKDLKSSPHLAEMQANVKLAIKLINSLNLANPAQIFPDFDITSDFSTRVTGFIHVFRIDGRKFYDYVIDSTTHNFLFVLSKV